MVVHAKVLKSFVDQSRWCDELGSPFTAALLRQAVADLEGEGALADLLGQWPGDPAADALPLRFAGALHALVLSGADPALAGCYPSPGASSPREPESGQDLWSAVLQAIRQHRATIDAYLAVPPQTNEIRRSAVLLGGFLAVQEGTQLPLTLLEIGASAGLNSIWDRYRYQLGRAVYGDPASPVVIEAAWTGKLLPNVTPNVHARLACDRSPIDLEDAEQRLRLRAYVWADQHDRLGRLDGAIALAQQTGCHVERADAGDWLAAQLAQERPGLATVVYHSVMWQYLPPATQERIRLLVQTAGRRADRRAPFAWLRFEPGQEKFFELRLTMWPDGTEYLLAQAHPHGASVRWLGMPVHSVE